MSFGSGVQGRNPTHDIIGAPNMAAVGTDCVLDTLQASTYLSQAGTAVDQATRTCAKVALDQATSLGIGARGEAACAMTVGAMIKSFGFSASFLSAAVNQCGVLSGTHGSKAAQCAADITGLVGAIGTLEMGGAGTYVACDPNGVGLPRPPNLAAPPPGVPPTQMTAQQRDYASTTASCAIYSIQSAWFIARAGLSINAAVTNCKPEQPKAACAASVSGILASLSAVSSYVSGAAATCSRSVNVPGAGCAAVVSMLTAGLSAIAATASSASLSCAQAQDEQGVAETWDRRLREQLNVSDNVTQQTQLLLL
eukprot:TRINITY_DN37343_c0_g1_i1.p1 TRINITY_DN37343_c0_g1~~TRINITY_DN37343_c0_g1_i1.p1  ORF type:complete len:348 (+),score=26.10 TRINITY_DN37343_c0_g1_i1:115-1044(+)